MKGGGRGAAQQHRLVSKASRLPRDNRALTSHCMHTVCVSSTQGATFSKFSRVKSPASVIRTHFLCRHQQSLFVCLLRFHVNTVASAYLAPIWHNVSHAVSNLCVEHFMSGLQFGYTKTMRELWWVTACERSRWDACRIPKPSWRQPLKRDTFILFMCFYFMHLCLFFGASSGVNN